MVWVWGGGALFRLFCCGTAPTHKRFTHFRTGTKGWRVLGGGALTATSPARQGARHPPHHLPRLMATLLYNGNRRDVIIDAHCFLSSPHSSSHRWHPPPQCPLLAAGGAAHLRIWRLVDHPGVLPHLVHVGGDDI